ncbi:unnamed protein product [Mytilus coruscus]|uniref:Death domain-containing protein n=1 Tax=Mytilus coruscus TaxID=42192 RepID=A0A6J8ANB7_MYTCO|nr:unnamed protein product [Mytilus coruscus]
MAARFPLFDILDEEFITTVGKNIGQEWKSLFIELGFEDVDLHHFEYDNTGLLNIVLDGLHVWKKKPLIVDERRNSKCIKEIFDLIIDRLRKNGCNTIAEDLLSKFSSSDINKIIAYLSYYLTNDERSLVLRSIRIPHEKIQSAPKQGQCLKEETKTILDNWYKDQHFKYWKCQELFTVFRKRGELSSITNITDKFLISGMSNISDRLII